ncbi:hypothetical protein RR48_04406 [Papilio machaon]|uniref:Uncharacterized protein n=1 Tax=Papilio machaon TaxID=76193 RepID=A0A0N1PGK1_PAPMA|nr:hypothetical protein RR48_04406 [Papilio machaon]
MLAESEGFKIKFAATHDPDIYSVVKEDMSASGVFSLIQKGDVDIVFGGISLLRERSEAFSYLYEHLAYTDELVVLVKKAGPVAPWKNIYLEFTYQVSNAKDLEKYQMEPCIPNNIKGLINSMTGTKYDVDMDEDCNKIMTSMHTVIPNNFTGPTFLSGFMTYGGQCGTTALKVHLLRPV